MRLALALLFLLSAFTGFAQAQKQTSLWRTALFEPRKLPETIIEKAAKLQVGMDLKFLSLEAFEGAGIAARYRYEFEPSYQEGYFQRVDRWKLETSLIPGSIVQDLIKIPISLHLTGGHEILFIRQFKSHKEALKASPYHLKHLPLDSERALKHLKPGDFAVLPARVNLMVKGKLGATSGIADANLHSHYMLSGEFQVHVLRAQEDKVRLRLFSVHRKDYRIIGGDANVGMKVFGMNILGKDLEAFASMQLAEFGIHKESGDVFLVDYVFDLKDPDARQAYDAILSSNHIMKSLKLLEPFTKDKRLSEMVISDATLADQIVGEDIGKPASEVRIHRVFKGLNKYNQENSLFKLGLGFFRYRDGSTYTENNLTSYSRLNHRTRYLFTNFTKAKKRSLFFRGNSDSLVSSSGLFLVDRRERIRGIKDLAFGEYLRDDIFEPDEQQDLQNHLRLNLHPQIYSRIDFSSLNTGQELKYTRFNLQVFLHRKVFHELMDIRMENLREKYYEFIQDKNVDYGILARHLPKEEDMLEDLYKVLCESSREWSVRKRIELSMKLRENPIFNQIGLGFVFSLLEEDNLEEKVKVVLDLKSPGNESLKFDWGNIRQSQIYEELLYLQSMMNERTLDLRDSVVDRNISQGMDGNLEEVVRSPAAAQSSTAYQNKLFEALYD